MAPVLQEIVSSLGFKIHIAENTTHKTGSTMDLFQTNLTSWELRGQKVPLELEWLERASSGQIQTLRAWRRHSSWRNNKKEQKHKTRKPENLPRNNYGSRTSLAWLQIKTFNSGNHDLKVPVRLEGELQQNGDFCFLFRLQPSNSTRAWHTRCSMLVEWVQNHLDIWKVQFLTMKKGVLKPMFTQCFSLYIRIAREKNP